jgi:CSLREA domain-containing protein
MLLYAFLVLVEILNMKLPKITVLVPSIFLFLFFAPIAAMSQGKLFTVNDIGDTNDQSVGDSICADSNGKCTLRAAIQEANSSTFQDGINFALPMPSTIDLTLGELVISSSVYIAGPGARNLTVERSFAAGTSQFRILRVRYPGNSIPTTIRGMTLKNGIGTGDGGAILSENQSILQLSDLVITGNTAPGSAGAIFSSGTLMLTRSLITMNTANGFYAGGVVNIGFFVN